MENWLSSAVSSEDPMAGGCHGKDSFEEGEERMNVSWRLRLFGRIVPFSALAVVVSFGCMALVSLLAGCATVPANKIPMADKDGSVMKALMKRNDRIVRLSEGRSAVGKPTLLLLHGATDDPTEMMGIAAQFQDEYEILVYSYNFHERLEKVAARLGAEVNRLKREGRLGESLTVIAFSYGAIVFRGAVVLADESTFTGATLIQLVPTSGGSRRARWMKNPLAPYLVSFASKPSVAENPYGPLAKKLWEGEGNGKFYRAISVQRMYTILLEDDPHSLAMDEDKRVRQRYRNGLGMKIVVIPKSAGVSHDYFPTERLGLEYLRRTMQRAAEEAITAQDESVPGVRGNFYRTSKVR